MLSVVHRPKGREVVSQGARGGHARPRQLRRHPDQGARARRGQHARRAPRHRRPAAPGPRARPADDPHRRPPRRPQAPRRRAARDVAAARRPPRPALGRGRRRPGTAGARAHGGGARAHAPRRLHRASCRPTRSSGPRPCSRCPASTRRSASPTSRRWRPASPPSAAAARPGRRRSARAAAGSGSSAPATRRASPTSSAACSRTRPGAASSAPRPADRRARVHVGGVRPRHRRRLRGGAAVSKPVLFVTNHAPAVPRRRVREAARARGRGVRADRRRRPPRRRRGRRRTCRSRSSAPQQREVARLAASGDYRAVVAGLSGRVAPLAAYLGRAPGARPVRPVGDRCGRTRARCPTPPPTWWCATCTATPTRSPPTGPTSPRTSGRRAPGNPSWRPRRASTTSIGTDNLSGKSPRALPGGVCGSNREGKRTSSAHPGLEFLGPVGTQRRAGSGRRRSDPSPGRRHRRGPARRPADALPKYATSTREATLWSYRRSPPAISASRGDWWSTKPSTRESP